MQFHSGRFSYPGQHHKGKYRIFRFDGAIEVWLGNHWYCLWYR